VPTPKPAVLPAEQAAWEALYDGTGGATQWTNCKANRQDPCGCRWNTYDSKHNKVTSGVNCSTDGQHILRL
jgi:hypothetical protein